MLEALFACCQVLLWGQIFTMLFRCDLGLINVHKMLHVLCVVTLALGLRPRQGLAKVWAKNDAWESHFMFPGV